jgi:hypothetical protein
MPKKAAASKKDAKKKPDEKDEAALALLAKLRQSVAAQLATIAAAPSEYAALTAFLSAEPRKEVRRNQQSLHHSACIY